LAGKKIVLLEMSHSIWLALPKMGDLLESDLAEAMSLLESLKPHLENSSVGGEFRRFEKSLENFDTDDAVQSLQEIAEELDISLTEDG